VIILSTGKTEAGQISLKGSYSGIFANTQIDTNTDGGKAALYSTRLKGTFGSFSFQGVDEVTFAGSTTCPNGHTGLAFTLLRPQNLAAPTNYVQRSESTGDLLFSEATSETICFDPSTGIQFGHLTVKITGGTGRFADATETVAYEGTALEFFNDAAGNYFGELSGTYTGTITTPHSDDH
jgi:hypothetical protein